eukprot:CAMPEP_0201586046 /NCGR_PEP_ID=MMETSP0190_2-20130828/128338_1 /ASSEMBLY_ACC=CAM_ASM_000263 /TAXON_ID=37353 /ORGANISM="Rosalina sp." /LENGTH=165 /DNA_ID=CAMNT_0048033195 /DNA_START=8 /DNA_END=501 /DNA_ORIENTATION=+
MATAEDTGWADNVDYGDDDEDGLNDKMEMSKTDDENDKEENNNDWADDVDYGDDDDEDGIGDLDLSDDDDDDLPQTGGPMGSPMGSPQDFKSEITSELDNPNRIGVSYTLTLDPRDTPGDISDDDETAPGLRINHFQLLSSKQMAQENKENDYNGDVSDDTILGT